MSKLIDMDYEQLCQFKETLTDQLRLINKKLKVVNHVLTNQYQGVCGICDDDKYAYNDLPVGWGWLVDDKHPILLCDKCIKRWEDKYVICPTTRGEV